MILFYKNDFSLTGYIVCIPGGSSWGVKKEGEMGPVLGESPIDWKRQEQDTLLKQWQVLFSIHCCHSKDIPKGRMWMGWNCSGKEFTAEMGGVTRGGWKLTWSNGLSGKPCLLGPRTYKQVVVRDRWISRHQHWEGWGETECVSKC